MEKIEPHKLFVILGMHRSGTSAITRGMQVLGVDLGESLLPPVEGDNPKGYWEDIDLNRLNIEMLSALDSDWWHVAAIEPFNVETLRKEGYFDRAVELLRQKVNSASIFGFKDPRVAKLLPFWREVFNLSDFDVNYVMVVRHPLSVIKSLMKRGDIEIRQGYLLWLGYVIASLVGSVGSRRIVVDYDHLIQNPNHELMRVAKCAGLEVDEKKIQSYKIDFLDQGLRHTCYELGELLLDNACPPIVYEVYAALLDVASEKTRLDSQEFQEKLAYWSDDFLKLSRTSLHLVDSLLVRKVVAMQAIADRDVELANLAQLLTDRDMELANLTQLLTDRDRELGNLTQSLTDRDRQLTNFTQSLAERDTQIINLNESVIERDVALTKLNQVLVIQGKQVEHILGSRSWRITWPYRFVGYQTRRIYAGYRFCSALIGAFGGVGPLLHKVVNVARRNGLRGLLFSARNNLRFYKRTGSLTSTVSHSSNKKSEDLDLALVVGGPTISVIMPVYNTPIEMLSAAILSVVDQLYRNWELIVVDDKSTDPEVLKKIEYFVKQDERIKACYREENGNISKALNSGVQIAVGDFIAVLDHDDTLDAAALYWVAHAILANPSVDYIYTDEDKLSKDGRSFYGPFFKPDWSPEYILAMMYTCHLGVYRTSILRDIGGYRSEFDGAQDFDLTLRFLNRTQNVFHIPKVLYHWRVWEQSTAQSLDAKPYAEERARGALKEFLESRGERYMILDGPLPGHHQVKFLPKGEPLVSIVIPTANGSIAIGGAVERHIDAVTKSIFDRTKYNNFELIIVHNGNLAPEQLASFSKQENVSLVLYDAPVFSLSKKINIGCSHARGEFLVILNDDVRVISVDWLDQMLGMVQRDGVGVVGPKLLFPDETIQHAGVVLLGGLPGHAYYQWPKNADGYALGARVNRNYLAVTGACAITPKYLFDEVGGYSDRYPLNYNDVDYCLKLHRMGYRSVYLANVELYHYEGVSKEGGRSVSDSEINMFLEDWGGVYPYDPYYNPNLSQSAPYQFG